jgi:hypothetical protein
MSTKPPTPIIKEPEQKTGDKPNTTQLDSELPKTELSAQPAAAGPEVQPTELPTGPEVQPTELPTGPEVQPTGVPTGPEVQPTELPTGPEVQPTGVPTGPEVQPTGVPTGPEVQPTELPAGPTELPAGVPAGPTGVPTGPTELPAGPGLQPTGNEQQGQQFQPGNEQQGQQFQYGNEQQGQQFQYGNEQQVQQFQYGNEQQGQQFQYGNEQQGQQFQPGNEQPGKDDKPETKNITVTIDKSTLVSLSQNLNTNLLITISAYKNVLSKLTEIVTNPDKQTKINANIEMLNGIEKSVTELLGSVQENLEIPADKLISASKILEEVNKGNNSFTNTTLQIDAATILAFLGTAIAMTGGKKTKGRRKNVHKKTKRNKK